MKHHLFIFFCHLFIIIQAHQCIHDQIAAQNPVKHPPPQAQTNKRILVQAPQPFRITYDASSLDTSVTDPTLKQLIIDLVEASRGFFMKRIKIKGPLTENLVLEIAGTKCIGDFEIPVNDQSGGAGIADTDFHFYVSAEDAEADWMAYATYCEYSFTVFRPVAARLNFNLFHMKEDANWKLWLDTALHEMLHALAFDQRLYRQYKKASDGSTYGFSATQVETVRGLETTFLKTELLLDYLKDFFDCDDVIGVQLENEGSAGSIGSHFDRVLFYDEIMTASRLGHSKAFSKLIFTLLKDTGWYEVDDRYYDGMPVGYKMGCKFSQYACEQPPEGVTVDGPTNLSENLLYDFCTSDGQEDCTPDFTAQGVCQAAAPFADGCNLITWVSNLECVDTNDGSQNTGIFSDNQVFGLESRCFKSNFGGGGSMKCFTYKCHPDNTLSINYGDKTIECTKSGELASLDGVMGYLVCPDLDRFCVQGRKFCDESWCNHKGHCTGGVCTCISGYAGYDCSQTCNAGEYYNPEALACQGSCPDGTFANDMNQTCHTCHEDCLTCSDLFVDTCLTCDGKLFQVGKCVDSCEAGYYADSSTTCAVCDQNCLTCQNSSTECLTCKDNKYLDLATNACVSTCSNLVDTYNKQCVDSCPAITYQQGNECITCQNDTYLHGNSCVNNCPVSFWPNPDGQFCDSCHASCLTCYKETDDACLTCTGLSYLYDFKCGPTCPPGTYISENVCKGCSYKCRDCTNQDTCQSCSSMFYLNGNSCVSECPAGKVKNIVTKVCDACDAKCKECNITPQDCTACADTYYGLILIDKLNCVQECPDGFYQNESSCDNCFGSCQTCTGPSSDQCETCKPGLIKFEKECIMFCPLDGYYKDEDKLTCEECDKSCKQCNGPDSDNCVQCEEKLFLSETSCMEECPEGKIGNVFLKQCQSGVILRMMIVMVWIMLEL